MHHELDRLQGTWSVISLEVDGTAFGASAVAGAKLMIEGDQFTSIAMGATYKGTLQVDAEANPKMLRMNFTEGPEKGNTNFGIFELDGDRWKICLTMTGGPAPVTFATTRGSGQALELLTRDRSG